jgi:3-deoxy-D-manno-octulosonic-acid transferase
MLFIYQFLTIFLLPIYIIIILVRTVLGKEDTKRFLEKFSITNEKSFNKDKIVLWFHGASIGEIRSVFPVINKILKENKKINIVVTSVTLSSGGIIQREYRNNKRLRHQFIPFDNIFFVKRFLNKWKPNLVSLIDSEIWPNFITEIKKRNIPLTLINARITNKTYKRWKIVPSFAKKIFSSFDLSIASSEDSFKNLKKLKVNNIKFYGNLKFIAHEEKNKKLKVQTINFLKIKRVWCAASTHPTEEIFCIKSHLEIKKKYKNVLTLIVPRHIDRVKKIFQICKKFNLNTEILGSKNKINKDTEILLINSFGLLNQFYKYSNSVFMGKSLIKELRLVGGQNPIEATRHGCRIYHGPYVYNFLEIYKYLKFYGAAKEIKDSKNLSKEIIKNFKNPKKIHKNIIKKINQNGKNILNIVSIRIKELLKNEII